MGLGANTGPIGTYGPPRTFWHQFIQSPEEREQSALLQSGIYRLLGLSLEDLKGQSRQSWKRRPSSLLQLLAPERASESGLPSR